MVLKLGTLMEELKEEICACHFLYKLEALKKPHVIAAINSGHASLGWENYELQLLVSNDNFE